MSRYRIPCLIYAPGLIAPGVCARLASQIDIPPTLLGMLGISYDSQFMGRDLAQMPPEHDRAFISTYQNLGLIRDNRLVVLSPKQITDTFRIDDWDKSSYTTLEKDKSLTDEAVIWYQGASKLYRSGLLKRGAGAKS